MTIRIKIIVSSIIFISVVLAYSSAESVNITKTTIRNISMTYGFYIGQEYTLDGINRIFPEFSEQIRLVRMEFDAVFLSAIRNIDSTMKEYDKKLWNEFKTQLKGQLPLMLKVNNLSEKDAKKFIQKVYYRSKGMIQSPILETLLMFNPTYQKNPVIEIQDGFTKKYVCNGSGKAKGVKFSLEIPKSWSSKEAERPNIVRKFLSQNGRGSEIILIGVNTIPLPVDLIDAEQLISEMLESGGNGIIPPDGKLIGEGKIVIENLPGYWLHYKYVQKRLEHNIKMNCISYAVIYRNKVIQIQSMVMGNNTLSEKEIQERFDKFEPLFRSVVNSLVILNLYTQ